MTTSVTRLTHASTIAGPGTLYRIPRYESLTETSAHHVKMNTDLSLRACRIALAASLLFVLFGSEARAERRQVQSGAVPEQPTATQATRPPPFPSPYDKDALSPEYRIAPGDALQIFVWKEPDLSREVTVRTDGFLTMALLGDVPAVAKTPRGLAAELSEQLERFINSPTVTVTVVSSSAQRFFVVGEVGKPGEFPLLSRTTILQALALAGGFREYAKTDEIRIIRQEVLVGIDKRAYTREIVLPVDYKALARGQELHQNYVMKPGDVIVVP